MPRPLRIEAPGEFFHVLARGNDRRSIFDDDADRITFLETLAEACERFAVACHAYCLMGNHYHLLLQPNGPNLSSTLHRLNGSYARRLNGRHDRTGHVFEGRFKSLLIDRDAYLAAVSRYIALNPVRAKLVGHPAAWRWSSYRATVGAAPAPSFLTTDVVLGSSEPTDRKEAQKRYSEFVLAGLSTGSDERRIRRAIEEGGILGRASLRARLGSRLEPPNGGRGIMRAHRFLARPPLAILLWDVRHGARPSDRITSAYSRYGYRLEEIADALGVSVSTVQRAVRSRDLQGKTPSKILRYDDAVTKNSKNDRKRDLTP